MERLTVLGYEGLYVVEETGKVFSIGRQVKMKNEGIRTFKDRQLSPLPNVQTRYLQVDLWKNNIRTKFSVHRLVAEAFIPNPYDLPEVNHKDGNRENPNAENLEWCTRSQNINHAIQTGLRVYTKRLTEPELLDCLHSVINGESYRALSKRVPYKVPFLSTILRRLARTHKLEHLLDESLRDQRITRARINGAKNSG